MMRERSEELKRRLKCDEKLKTSSPTFITPAKAPSKPLRLRRRDLYVRIHPSAPATQRSRVAKKTKPSASILVPGSRAIFSVHFTPLSLNFPLSPSNILEISSLTCNSITNILEISIQHVCIQLLVLR
jgi:hypothetical protein